MKGCTRDARALGWFVPAIAFLIGIPQARAGGDAALSNADGAPQDAPEPGEAGGGRDAGTASTPPGAFTPEEEEAAKTLGLFFGESVQVSVPSARAEPLATAAAPLFVFTEDDIVARGYRDLADVFHDLPGVDVSSYLEFGTQLMFRGILANDKIVVLRDGVQITNPAGFNTTFLRNMPLYNVKRIEVLYGPASVIYGADAFAAVIQLISKDEHVPENNEHVPVAEAELSAGPFNPAFSRYQLDSHLSCNPRLGPYWLLAGVRTYQSNGPDLASAYPDFFAPLKERPPPLNQYNTPVRSWNAEAQLGTGNFAAGAFFSDHRSSSSIGRDPGPLGMYIYSPEAVFDLRLFQAFARHEPTYGPFELQTIVTFSDLRTAPLRFLDFGGVDNAFLLQQSIRLDHRTTWNVEKWLSASGGLRVQAFNVVPLGDLGPGREQPEFTGRSLRSFGLDHVVFNRYGVYGLLDGKPWEDLRLTAGLSWEYDGNTGEGPLLPRGGAVLRLFGGAAYLKALYGQAFVAAAPDNAFLTYQKPGEFIFQQNPKLKSTHLQSAELIYTHQILKWLHAELSSYYNKVSGLVEVANTGPVTVDGKFFPNSQTNANAGSLWSAGGEANLHIAPTPWLQSFLSYALIWGREELPGTSGGTEVVTLSRISHHKVLAGFTFRRVPHLAIDARLRWVSPITTLPTNSIFHGQTMPGYYTVNLNVRGEDLVPGLDAHLLIDNLTNASYFTFASPPESPPAAAGHVPQPGFRFLLGLTYRWGAKRTSAEAATNPPPGDTGSR